MALSDHEMIYVTYKKMTKPKVKSTFIGRSYVNFDEQVFQENLLNCEWQTFDNEDDVDNAWEIMLNNIRRVMDNMCPLRTFHIRKMKEEWVSNELLEIIKDKDKALAKAKKTGTQADWVRARRMRNETIKLTRKARADFIKEKLSRHEKDSKKLWRELSEILPTKKGRNKNKISLKKSSGMQVPSCETADFINDFFVGIGPNLSKVFNSKWAYKGRVVEADIGNFETNVDEVVKYIKQLDVSKSSAIEGVSTRVFKVAFLAIPEKITVLFNKSLSLGIFPSRWKYAKVVPLPKAGDLTDVSNWRPVSLLPLPGKILEKTVHNRILNFFKDNHVLDERQGGFREGYSTTRTIVEFTEDLYMAMNNKQTTMAAFVDFKKAFDTVNHAILIKKLQKVGIRGLPCRWLTSYLNNRCQVTLANDTTSTLRPITCGVPQGSVLGPLLFLVYINDIFSVVTKANIRLYADDTVIYMSDADPGNASSLLQEDLIRLTEWCALNKLSINERKTKAMIFGTKHKISSQNGDGLFINKTSMEFIKSYKYLGVVLDNMLTLNEHINKCVKAAAHKTYLLTKIRPYINEVTSNRIYKSMILPYIDYGDIIYGAASVSKTNKLQKIQNQCLRICSNSDIRTSVIEMHRRARVANLKD